MKPYAMSRSSLTINNLWKARGRRPTLRRTCKVFIPRDLRGLDMLRVPASYEEDSFLVKKLKTITKHKMHHWILIASISCYLYAGAIMFQYIESHYGEILSINMSHPRETFLKTITNSTQLISRQVEWLEQMRRSLLLYEHELINAAKRGYDGEDTIEGLRPYWSLETSILYCLTVITTVGYGNIAPSTDAGRAVTIIYAFLGIPLMLMVLADLGKLFTKAIKLIFRYMRRFYRNGRFKKDNLSALGLYDKPLQYMTVSWRTVNQNSNNTPPKTNGHDNCNQVTTLTLHNDNLYKDLDFMNANETNHKHVEMEDEFNIPVTLAVAMVLAYMVLGAQLFAIWEDWTFFESFYFVFISMSTVGFGDYVPSNQTYMMGAFVYLVFGLTLTSMCINVIQEKLSATFQKAKVRIGNTIGLDVNTLLSEDGQKNHKHLNQHTHGKMITPDLSVDNYESKPYEVTSSTTNAPEKINDQIENLRSEPLLNIPSDKRFTFYDSPYSTIQNNNLYSPYNTATSINSLYAVNENSVV